MKLTLDECLRAPKVVAVDFETTGLDWVRDDPILVGFYGSDFSGYFNIFEYSTEALRDFFTKFLSSHSCIFHNAKFDFHFLNKSVDSDFWGKSFDLNKVDFSDTMLLAQLIDENRKHSLESLSLDFFGLNACAKKQKVDEVAKEIRSRKKNKAFSEVPNDLLGARAVEDCKNTYDLYSLLRPKLPNSNAYSLEKKLLRALVRAEENGVLIDVEYLKGLKATLEEEAFSINKKHDFNLNSSKQVSRVLFDEEEIIPTLMTSKGNPSTAVGALTLLDNSIAKDIVRYRTITKMLSTYVEPFIERVDVNNRLHSNFKQLGARTNRLSCVNPNLQQVPKDGLIRKSFIGDICSFDFSQMEAVLYVLFAKEEKLLQDLKENRNLYLAMASNIYKKDIPLISKLERDTAKDIFLGTIYGMGQQKLEMKLNSIGLSIQDVRRTFPKLHRINKSLEASLERDGYIEMIYGHRRHLSLRDSYKALNSLIQGQSIVDLPLRLLDKFRITVHDENVFEDLTEEEVLEVREIMTRYDPLLKVKFGRGSNWYECNASAKLI